MAKFPQVDFKVTWRPFQLDSNAPKQGVNKLQMYNEKFGAARIASMLPRMNQVMPPYKHLLTTNLLLIPSHELLEGAPSVAAA